MPERSSNKRPRDLNQLAAKIIEVATEGEIPLESTKNPAAVALGRLGGQKGGRARANKLTAELLRGKRTGVPTSK
jgi:hypothetical protein